MKFISKEDKYILLRQIDKKNFSNTFIKAENT